GGLMSPLGEEEYVADLAYDLGYPLVVVTRNALGTINQTLQTLIAAATFRDGLAIAGIVLNQGTPPTGDASTATNRQELAARSEPPILAEVAWCGEQFDAEVDWFRLAKHWEIQMP
ncbi:MAG: AAA family ATPase, partial [Planctomycetota bacterium]